MSELYKIDPCIAVITGKLDIEIKLFFYQTVNVFISAVKLDGRRQSQEAIWGTAV